jgi:hypothetical protein
MKTKIITCALIVSVSFLTAQTEKKQATVRIKKVENINGVETVTDTTYTTNDPSSIKVGEDNVQIIETSDGKNGATKKMVIVNGGDPKNADHVKIIQKGEGLDEEIEKALKEAGVDPNMKGTQKMVIINDDSNNGKGDKTTKIVMIKRVDITNANDVDVKRISKQAGETDGKLNVEKMNFYPNPSNGKFSLSFNLPGKGDTEVNIMNMEGRSVYSEKLPGFSGNYEKEIDISKNAKGVYFVRVEQGKHAQVKKIVLE